MAIINIIVPFLKSGSFYLILVIISRDYWYFFNAIMQVRWQKWRFNSFYSSSFWGEIIFEGDMLIFSFLLVAKNVFIWVIASSIRFLLMSKRTLRRVVYATLLPRENASLDGEPISLEECLLWDNRLLEKIWFICRLNSLISWLFLGTASSWFGVFIMIEFQDKSIC